MAERASVIKFHFLISVSVRNRRQLKSVIQKVFEQEQKSLARLDFIFCSDDYLLSLNQRYLQHDTLTDIITFDLSENKKEILAEIYISADRVKENAFLFHATFRSELARVIIHGALHLCGYTDKSSASKAAMRLKEDEYLKLLI